MKQMIAYVEELNLLGQVLSIDLVNQKLTVDLDGKGKVEVVEISKAELLEEILRTSDGQIVYNRDVFERQDGVYLEVVLEKNGELTLYILDEELNRDSENDITIERLSQSLALGAIEIVGSIHEVEVLKDTVDLDFNIQVAKMRTGNYYTYYYVCNDKKNGLIDLIKVVFIGNRLIEEESYERLSLTYDSYEDAVFNGDLILVSQNEFSNYAFGVLQGAKAQHVMTVDEDTSVYEPISYEGIEEEDDDFCEECSRQPDDCECSPW